MGGVVKAVTKAVGGVVGAVAGKKSTPKPKPQPQQPTQQQTQAVRRKEAQMTSARKSAVFEANRKRKADTFLSSTTSLGDDQELGKSTVLGSKY